METEIQELRLKAFDLEAQNKQLSEELQQYKSVCESQQLAIKSKDELLVQYKELNESLQHDVKTLRELNNKASSSKSTPVAGFPSTKSSNPWTEDGSDESEPEQFRTLFVGGLDYATEPDALRTHFEKFGEVISATVMRDQNKMSRGFGFIIYKTAAMLDEAQKNRPHVVDSRTVDTKRSLPKEDTNIRTKKMFVGGIRTDVEKSTLEEYFSKYGKVENVEIVTYKDTGKRRGFAFVYFDDFDPVDKLILIKHHMIEGNRCEVKKAVEKTDHNRRMGIMEYGGGNQGGGHHQDSYNYGTGQGGAGVMGQYQNNYNPGPGQGQSGGQQQYPPQGGNTGGGGQADFAGAQTLMANFMNFMAQQAGNAGPMRNQNSHSNRSTGPYNT